MKVSNPSIQKYLPFYLNCKNPETMLEHAKHSYEAHQCFVKNWMVLRRFIILYCVPYTVVPDHTESGGMDALYELALNVSAYHNLFKRLIPPQLQKYFPAAPANRTFTPLFRSEAWNYFFNRSFDKIPALFRSYSPQTFLIYFCKVKTLPDALVPLVQDGTADLTTKYYAKESTLFHLAVQKKWASLVETLLVAQADLYVQNKHGDTPLSLALRYNLSIIEVDSKEAQIFRALLEATVRLQDPSFLENATIMHGDRVTVLLQDSGFDLTVFNHSMPAKKRQKN